VENQKRKITMKLQNMIHILIGIVCIGLLLQAQAVSPAPAKERFLTDGRVGEALVLFSS
jgi:hypothetical protein